MFSGIVEEAATVVALKKEQGNLHLTLSCSFTDELKIDQSVAQSRTKYGDERTVRRAYRSGTC